MLFEVQEWGRILMAAKENTRPVSETARQAGREMEKLSGRRIHDAQRAAVRDVSHAQGHVEHAPACARYGTERPIGHVLRHVNTASESEATCKARLLYKVCTLHRVCPPNFCTQTS